MRSLWVFECKKYIVRKWEYNGTEQWEYTFVTRENCFHKMKSTWIPSCVTEKKT